MLLKVTKVNKMVELLTSKDKKIIAGKLQKDILLIEGYKPLSADRVRIKGLEEIENAFPDHIFPTGAIHEFLAFCPEHIAASCGFIGGILSALMKQSGACIWISAAPRLFPAALKTFCVEPHKVIFVNQRREKDILWATEEALKCNGLAAVIAEVGELTFMQSRRLQLSVEASKVTAFILRNRSNRSGATACMARWRIVPKPSLLEDGLPGVGFPRWEVELQKVRNGKPGKWTVEWMGGRFAIVEESKFILNVQEQIRRAG